MVLGKAISWRNFETRAWLMMLGVNDMEVAAVSRLEMIVEAAQP